MNSRYIRQTSLRDFGENGQAKLFKAKVLVVGLGGLGLPVLQYLNAMGVGTLGLMDQDVVEMHNLQRQVLYTEKDLGKLKLEVVHNKLTAQNSQTTFKTHDTFLTKENALKVIEKYDLVVDATDNFPTRYLINDACVILNKPFVYGALHGFEGHISVFNYNNGPTYRCLYPEMPNAEEIPNCNENGVLGVIPGIMGTLQALEAVKVLTGVGEVLSGKLMVYNGLNQFVSKISFKTIPENKKITRLQDFYEPVECDVIPSIGVNAFQTLRQSKEKYTLIDVRTTEEFDQSHLNEAINVPLDNLDNFERQISTDKEVYIICQSGKRSELALKHLQTAYPNLTFYHILGGMNKMMTVCP
ncbi:sulfurtransferase [Flagellimonas aquimarina]|jgi:molybdopterin/thiamine biosynthesis adenylyltransferase/rhodanese-related sulfurtransferase|uniref:Molybdopterin-synthase adenylyltransferase n=2 Tax=Flagellimonas aquimarina TaxID=2201895 RepID=A0A316KXH3_9FLAO|nr:sulfurtransferase [Allomuricauda koreensis]